MRSSSPRRIERSSATHSTRSSRDIGNTRPFGVPATRMARPADALQQRRDPMRRSDLAHEVDVADVDAELERRGGDERLERARSSGALSASSRRSFDRLPWCAVTASSPSRSLRWRASALGEPPRVDEDQRRAVFAHELGEAVVVLLPDLVDITASSDDFGSSIARSSCAAVAFVDDGAVGVGRVAAVAAVADEERRHGFDRRLRRRQADAQERRCRPPPAGARATAPGARRGACRSRRESRRRSPSGRCAASAGCARRSAAGTAIPAS